MKNWKSSFAGKKIGITGGLGFIGSNLAIRLCQMGASVTIYDLDDPKFGANLYNIDPVKDDLQIIYGDLRDKQRVTEALRGCEYVFSLAGQVSHMGSMRDPNTDLEINGEGHLNVLEACKSQMSKVVLTSTRQVYGKILYLPVDERHPVQPPDVNAISKIAAEQLTKLYFDIYGLPASVLRLTNIYGPRMDIRSADKGFISVFVRRAVTGQAIEIFGDGEQRRDLNHVDDLVEALFHAATNSGCYGKLFNVGHSEAVSLNQIILGLQKSCVFPFKKIPFPEELKKIDIGDYFTNFSAFTKETSWKPQIDFASGLASTIDFYKSHLPHYY